MNKETYQVLANEIRELQAEQTDLVEKITSNIEMFIDERFGECFEEFNVANLELFNEYKMNQIKIDMKIIVATM